MISIAMTTYNGEKFLKSQINSLLDQTLPFDELVICDDGSCDKTIDLIKSYKDKRIKLFENTNRLGYIKNFQKALSLTNGDFIFLCDQDDIWDKMKLQRSIQILKSYNCSAICTGCSLIDQEGKLILDAYYFPYFNGESKVNEIHKVEFKKLMFYNVAQGCTYCFTKKVKNLYLKTCDSNISHDLAIMIAATDIGNVVYINEPLVQYRIHSDNTLALNEKFIKHIPSLKPNILRYIQKINSIKKFKLSDYLFADFVQYLRIPLLYKFIKKDI